MLGVKPVTLHIVVFAEIFRISDHLHPAGTEMTVRSVLGNPHLYDLFCSAVGADEFVLHADSFYIILCHGLSRNSFFPFREVFLCHGNRELFNFGTPDAVLFAVKL